MQRSSLRWLSLATLVGCSSASDPGAPTVSNLSISGPDRVAGISQQVQLNATAVLSDGTVATPDGGMVWQSVDTAVAVISASGLVSLRSLGTAKLTASYQGVTASKTIIVTRLTTQLPFACSETTCTTGGNFPVEVAGQVDATGTITAWANIDEIMYLFLRPYDQASRTCGGNVAISAKVSTTTGTAVSGRWDTVPAGHYCVGVGFFPLNTNPSLAVAFTILSP
jgi:hypothetical protein